MENGKQCTQCNTAMESNRYLNDTLLVVLLPLKSMLICTGAQNKNKKEVYQT
jgi:hypothetical protein